MKILCLIMILANITVFLWEYRSGAFVTTEKQPAPPPTIIKEPIVLVSEIKYNPEAQANPTSSPAQNPLTKKEQLPEKNNALNTQPDAVEREDNLR